MSVRTHEVSYTYTHILCWCVVCYIVLLDNLFMALLTSSQTHFCLKKPVPCLWAKPMLSPVCCDRESVASCIVCLPLYKSTRKRGSILTLYFTSLGLTSSHLQAMATQACRWLIMTVLSPLACCVCVFACVCMCVYSVGVGVVSVQLSASTRVFSSTWLLSCSLTG